jgi:hypothetical protein
MATLFTVSQPDLARELQARCRVSVLERSGAATYSFPFGSQCWYQLLPMEITMQMLDREKTDLTLHVELCAERHEITNGKLAEAAKRIQKIEYMMYLVISILLGGGYISLNQIQHVAQAVAAEAPAARAGR